MIIYKISKIINTICDGCKIIMNRRKSVIISSISKYPITNVSNNYNSKNNVNKVNTKGLSKLKVRVGKER